MYTPTETKLCLDVMLGGIVSPLRMIGYDTAYALDRDIEADDAIIELADRENRLLLTRDQEVASRAELSHLLTETDPQEQLRELSDGGFELALTDPRRCSHCNGDLRKVTEDPGPKNGPDPESKPVWQCRDCGQFYWVGSHWTHLDERLEEF
jgi:uncharacterized protein with PIN domain